MKKLVVISTALFALPLISLAASGSGADLSTLVDTVKTIRNIVDTLIPTMVAAAVVVFFWGLVQYVWNKSANKETEGKKIMIAGLVSLFIMVSLWGIIRLVAGTVGVDPNVNEGTAPHIQYSK